MNHSVFGVYSHIASNPIRPLFFLRSVKKNSAHFGMDTLERDSSKQFPVIKTSDILILYINL